MSTDQLNLSESIDRKANQTRERVRETLEGRGAVYGRRVTQPDAEASRGRDSECRNCGRSVSSRFVAVFGNNDGEIHGCTDCVGYAELFDGTAARGGQR